MLWVMTACYDLNKSSRAHDVLSYICVRLALVDRYMLRIRSSMASADACHVLGKLCWPEFEWSSTLTAHPESYTVPVLSRRDPALCRFLDIETSLRSWSRVTVATMKCCKLIFFQNFNPAQNLPRKVGPSSARNVSSWSD